MKIYITAIIMSILLLFGCFASFTQAETKFRFVRIENLAEQVVAERLLKDIYRKVGLTISIEAVPGKRATMLATTGKADGETLRVLSYGEKNKMMIRVPTPYSSLETTVFTKLTSKDIDIKSKDDLKKYKIVIVRGVQHTIDITEGVEFVHEIDSLHQIMKFLNADRADIAITNNLSGIAALKQLSMNDNIIPLITLEILDLFHYVHEKNKDIVPLVDGAIKEMIKSGELKELRIKYEKDYLDNIKI